MSEQGLGNTPDPQDRPEHPEVMPDVGSEQSAMPDSFRHEPAPIAEKSDFSYELHGTRIEDPYQWLEQVRGQEVDAYVDAQNERTDRRYRQGELFDELVGELTRRNVELPFYMPGFNEAFAVRRRSTPDEPKGVLEICSLEEFEAKGIDAQYEQLISFDELAEQEGRDWLSKGTSFNGDNPDRVILALSDGGTDAVLASLILQPGLLSMNLRLSQSKGRFALITLGTLMM